jgi:catechol 2,3-dioxygenase-like lactoylglutathione lyase family enzyme
MSAPGSLIGFVPITDGDRARAFYTGVLGLEYIQDDGFALVFRSGANMVRLVRMQQHTPAQGTILGWEPQDIVTEVKRLTEKGVTFLRYGFFEQDELGIWTAPNGNKVAWFTDPDGNTLSLSQHS